MATSVSHASDALVLGVPWTALLTRSLSGTVGAESIPPPRPSRGAFAGRWGLGWQKRRGNEEKLPKLWEKKKSLGRVQTRRSFAAQSVVLRPAASADPESVRNAESRAPPQTS